MEPDKPHPHSIDFPALCDFALLLVKLYSRVLGYSSDTKEIIEELMTIPKLEPAMLDGFVESSKRSHFPFAISSEIIHLKFGAPAVKVYRFFLVSSNNLLGTKQ